MRLGPFKSRLGTPGAGSYSSGICKLGKPVLQRPPGSCPRGAPPRTPAASWGCLGLGLGENEPHLPRQRPPQQGRADSATPGGLGPRRPPGVGCALSTRFAGRRWVAFLPLLARGGLCSPSSLLLARSGLGTGTIGCVGSLGAWPCCWPAVALEHPWGCSP